MGERVKDLDFGVNRKGLAVAHIVLSGLLILASIWHWTFWDLELFRDPRTGNPALQYELGTGTTANGERDRWILPAADSLVNN